MGKFYCMVYFLVGCVDGEQCVCGRMMGILYIEPFVNHLDPSLISRLIIESDFDRIK